MVSAYFHKLKHIRKKKPLTLALQLASGCQIDGQISYTQFTVPNSSCETVNTHKNKNLGRGPRAEYET